MTPRPRLIVITGRPGSGKTTLAHRMREALRCPLVSRDEMKEGFLQNGVLRSDDAELAQRIYATFFDALELLLSRGVSVIAEAAFQHKLWSPKLTPLREHADIRIVVCKLSRELAAARHEQRKKEDPDRERFHPDPEPLAEYDPPHLGDDVPLLSVDTSDGYSPSFDSIVTFARSENRERARP